MSVGAELSELSYRGDLRRPGARLELADLPARAGRSTENRSSPARSRVEWRCRSRGAGPELLYQLSYRSA
jgi:hypothetical protein